MAKYDDPTTRKRRAKGEDTLSGASDLLKGLMQNVQSPLGVGFLRLKIEAQWSEAVGTRLAEITAPVGYHNGVLEIWVAHSTWVQELHYAKDTLRSGVNSVLGLTPDSFGYCKEIKFTLNRRT